MNFFELTNNKLTDQSEQSEEKLVCDNCDKEMDKPYWSNIFRDFCSLECTNKYLWSEGYNHISGPNESATIRQEFRRYIQ